MLTKPEGLGLSLLDAVSLAPPFTFYNHRIIGFKLEGILRGHLVQSPGIIIFILKISVFLSCHYFDISVLPWYTNKSFSFWVRCELQMHTEAPGPGESPGVHWPAKGWDSKGQECSFGGGGCLSSVSQGQRPLPCPLRECVRVPSCCLSPSP